MRRTLVGFGFGPIQAGVFVPFARTEGFEHITIAEIDQTLVRALRSNGGAYTVNVAHADRLEVRQIEGVEILDPALEEQAGTIRDRLREASTIVTALPSPASYAAGGDTSVVAYLARALQEAGPPVVVYTTENHPSAPACLEAAVRARLSCGLPARPVAVVGCVIGKMSQMIQGPHLRRRRDLVAMVPDLERVFLVESYDRIIAGRVPELCSGGRMSSLVEVEDLRPYQELKLFGHNAAHAMLGFVARARGIERMPTLRKLPTVLRAVGEIITFESGATLQRRWPGVRGELASAESLKQYADDLLGRMTNPFLDDAVERVIRDLPRELARDDRLFGALSLCDQSGVNAPNLETAALGGVAVWRTIVEGGASFDVGNEDEIAADLERLWGGATCADERRQWAHRRVAARARWW